MIKTISNYELYLITADIDQYSLVNSINLENGHIIIIPKEVFNLSIKNLCVPHNGLEKISNIINNMKFTECLNYINIAENKAPLGKYITKYIYLAKTGFMVRIDDSDSALLPTCMNLTNDFGSIKYFEKN